MTKKQISIGEVKELLESGKKVRVKTVGGEYTNISKFIEKGILRTFLVTLENELTIKVSKEHKFFSSAGWIEAQDLKPRETAILCEDGTYSKVKSVDYIGEHRIVDITVDHPEHCYYGNNILNHNSGKSYMAAQIAANAQKKDIDVIYFDSESAIDPDFWERIGVDVQNMVYVQATSVEFVLETIEDLLKNNPKRMLFIWDSFALTPSLSDVSGTFNPNESMAVKPRIMSKGLSKIIQPIANTQSTLLVLNQLKTNLGFTGNIKYITDSDRYTTPGGKGLAFAYSLRMWLTSKKGKESYVYDDNGYRIGNEVKVRLEKSRFGSVSRECLFRILWAGEEIGIMDDESVFEAVKPFLKQSGAWYEIEINGQPKKFQSTNWIELMDDDVFRNTVYDLMEKEVVVKFEKREGNASNYYDLEGKNEQPLDE